MSLTSHLMRHAEISLTDRQRSLHTYVIGQSGMGKSKAMETWIVQNILAGEGVGVIDPHGDLYANLIAWLSQKPELWHKVILVDPTDPTWTIGFNPLQAANGVSSERLALFLTDVCVKLWSLETANTPRLVWVLTNTFLALSNLNLGLLSLPRFLGDRQFRATHLESITLPAVRQFFENDFPQSDKAAQQWISPVLNKLGRLLFDPEVSLMFQSSSTIDFRRILDERMVLLINVPKGILSEGLSSLLAAFFVAHIQKAALARAEEARRSPFYLYLDEFQHYTTGNITDILAESRKYRLSLTLAHQYLAQLNNEIRHAVLNTAGNLVSFRVGFDDACLLAKEIFLTPSTQQEAQARLYHRQHGMIAMPTFSNVKWEDFARQLSTLPEREFWYRRRGNHRPIKEVSFWFPQTQSATLRSDIRDLEEFSGNRFGRRKSELRNSPGLTPEGDFDLPLWAD